MVLLDGERFGVGVLVPEGDGLALDKRLSIKGFPKGKPEFYIAPMHEKVVGRFVPISPEEPFEYIAKLKEAFLTTRGGQLGIMIPEKNGRE